MANQADGSIIIDTELDTKGFDAGSAELQRAIKSLNTKVESLGPTFQKAVSGNVSALSTFDSKAGALENTITQLEAKLASLGNEKVPTEDYKWLTAEIEKANKELNNLYERQAKLEALGVKEDSQAWKSLQYDISLAKSKLREYKGEQANMTSNGTAFQMGVDTAEYAQLESSLASAKSRLAEMRSEAESAGRSTSKLGRIAGGIKSALAGIGRVGVAGFKKLAGGIKSAVSHLNIFKRSSGGAEGAIGRLGKKLTGIWGIFKRMALRKILMSVISGLKDSMNNLAQYSSGVNSNLSTLKSGLTQLKNSLAAAFAPILSVVTPILATLISYLSSAVTWIGKLFAALSGAKTFTKAKAVQEDYAASLGDTAKEAKETKRQLLGLDEINKLGDKSADSIAGNGISPSDMFEEVNIDTKITDFVDQIKAAFKNGNYAEIGKILGTKINEAVQKAKDFISWDNVGGKITKAIKGFAEGLNSLIYTIKWDKIGETFSQGINTIIKTVSLLTTEIDWPALTGGIAQSLSSMITGIHWDELGRLLSTQVRTLLQSARSFVQNFKWFDIGKSIATGINNIDWEGILSDLAGLASDLLKSAFDLVIGFIDNLDWQKLGGGLWNGLCGMVENIDWSGLIQRIFHLIGSAWGARAGFFWGLAKSIWEWLKEGLKADWASIKDYIEEAGGDIIQGLWNGIKDAFKNAGKWILENIWNPFIEGFKNAFGIHSPSTKMAEQGDLIIQGLWEGIKNAWHSITEFFTQKLDGIKNCISNAWSNIKSGASTAWNNIKSTVSTAWDNLKNTASTKFENIKSTIKNKGWSGLGSNIASGIHDGISSKWDWLKSKVSSLATSLLDKAKSVLGIHSPSKLFRDTIGMNIGLGLGEGIEKSQPSVLRSVSDMADAISDEMKNGDYTLSEVKAGSSFESSLVNFSDTITDSFSSLIDKLQAIANNVTFSMPAMATGSTIPYSVKAVEYISSANRQTMYRDDEQIIESVSDVARANDVQNALLRELIRIGKELVDKPSDTVITTSQITDAFSRMNRRAGQTVVPTGY